jgi:hypothetical protein
MATYKVKGIKDVRVGYISAGNIVYEDVPFGTELTLDADIADVDFEGDGQVEKAYYDASFSGTFSADKWRQEVLQRIFNKTPVVAGLPGDVASRQYMGTQDELAATYFEIGVTLDAIDEVTGGAKSLRLTVFKAKAGPYVQGNVGHRTKMGMQVSWTGIRTSTDIDDQALPSVPTGGAVYAIDVLV